MNFIVKSGLMFPVSGKFQKPFWNTFYYMHIKIKYKHIILCNLIVILIFLIVDRGLSRLGNDIVIWSDNNKKW